MPFGFCDTNRVEPTISSVSEREKNRALTGAIKQGDFTITSQVTSEYTGGSRAPTQRDWFLQALSSVI